MSAKDEIKKLKKEIERHNFLYQSRKLLYDAGMDWNSLTVFGPIRFKLKPQKKLKKSNLYS